MPAALLLIFLLPAAADWLAVWKGWQRVNFFTKPLAMLTLIIGFGLWGHFKGSLLWFGIGFCFSLLGDVFLLLSHGYFLYGLSAFLIAHLVYTVGFNSPLPEIGLPFYLLGLIILVAWWLLRRRLDLALHASGRQSKMRLAVALYSAVIAAMLFSALATLFRPDWELPAAGCAALGGFLFFWSDTLLAFDRFVRPFPRARFWVRVTYHLGQLGLALGALLHALRNY